MTFWLIAAALALLVAAVLAAPFLRRAEGPASRAEHDVEALRAQLAEIDQDLGRGVLTEDEAARARIEVSRRLLAAADRVEREAAPVSASPRVGLPLALAALLVPLGGVAIYAGIGAPGYPDRPLAQRVAEREMARPSQAQAEALAEEGGLVSPPPPAPPMAQGAPDLPTIIGQIEARLEEAPDDPRGLAFLASFTAAAGRWSESWQAYARLIEVAPDAMDGERYAEMGESMVMAAGGYVSPEAEAVLGEALRRDPMNAQARHFTARGLAQRGELEKALDIWAAMLATAPPDAPWLPMVADNARNAASELGVQLPPSLFAAPGPSREDMEAAAAMTPEERQAMVEGMVDGLAAKLADDPDDLDGWLRLIRSYRTLGREQDADEALRTARDAFAGDDAALARLDGA